MSCRKFKILYIHHGNMIGGAPTSLRNLIKGLLKEDQDIDITVACISSSMIPFFQEVKGIKVKKYVFADTQLGRYLMGWSKLSVRGLLSLGITFITALPSIFAQIRFIKSEAPDILHLNSSILWSAGIAGKLARVPIIWHIREASDDYKYNFLRILYSKLIKMISGKVVCIGPQEYKKVGGKNSKNVVMIHNSLDDSYFEQMQNDQEAIRKRVSLPAKQFIYLSLGGDSFRNGAFQLIESLKYLDEDYACVIAGQPPKILSSKPGKCVKLILKIEDELFQKGFKNYLISKYQHRLSESLNTVDHKRLFLPGFLKDVKCYIKACDVLVFPGTYPHSARPIYEAWAMKKPVVGFDSEVMRMDVEDGVDGIIVKEHTAEALAKALSYLRNSPDICRKMGEEGYKKAITRFSLKENTVKLLDVYQSIRENNI